MGRFPAVIYGAHMDQKIGGHWFCELSSCCGRCLLPGTSHHLPIHKGAVLLHVVVDMCPIPNVVIAVRKMPGHRLQNNRAPPVAHVYTLGPWSQSSTSLC
jgi:hypothetical protein